MTRSILLNLLILCPALLFGEMRDFSSMDGKTFRGEIEASEIKGRINLKSENGSTYKNLRIEIFSLEDQLYINNWLKEHEEKLKGSPLKQDSKIKVSVSPNRNNDKNKYGDIDDRIIQYKPRISISNEDKKLGYSGVNGTLIFIGRDVINKNVYNMMYIQKFSIDIPPEGNAEWQGPAFSHRFDPDYGGYDYDGYLLVLSNSPDTTHVKGSKKKYEECYKNILKADTKKVYDPCFSEPSTPPPAHYYYR